MVKSELCERIFFRRDAKGSSPPALASPAILFCADNTLLFNILDMAYMNRNMFYVHLNFTSYGVTAHVRLPIFQNAFTFCKL